MLKLRYICGKLNTAMTFRKYQGQMWRIQQWLHILHTKIEKLIVRKIFHQNLQLRNIPTFWIVLYEVDSGSFMNVSSHRVVIDRLVKQIKQRKCSVIVVQNLLKTLRECSLKFAIPVVI